VIWFDGVGWGIGSISVGGKENAGSREGILPAYSHNAPLDKEPQNSDMWRIQRNEKMKTPRQKKG
jgi:hypothetical protein